MLFIFILICGYIGYFVFTSIFDWITGYSKEPKQTFIDNSIHYHRHLTITNKDEPTITIEDERIDIQG